MSRQVSALCIAAAMFLVPLAGCEHSLVGQNLGNAYREDMNAQIADPEAGRANEPGPVGLDGRTGEDVMGRYHTQQEKEQTPTAVPLILSTGGTSQ